jgi:Transmembrane amino acid transporter protein
VLNDITLVFGVIGSLAGSYLIFIAPSSFYLMAVSIEGEEISTLKKLLAWVYLIFGFIVAITCLFATIYTAAV